MRFFRIFEPEKAMFLFYLPSKLCQGDDIWHVKLVKLINMSFEDFDFRDACFDFIPRTF